MTAESNEEESLVGLREKTETGVTKGNPGHSTFWGSHTSVVRPRKGGLRSSARRCRQGGRQSFEKSIWNSGAACTIRFRSRGSLTVGRRRVGSLLWCAYEWRLPVSLPEGGPPIVVWGIETPEPQTSANLGSDEMSHGQMVPCYPRLSSLPFSSLWRHYLRQESCHGGIIPHVWICAGGAGQPASLLRPICNYLNFK